jgi:sec-independent protein translocase protein TatA
MQPMLAEIVGWEALLVLLIIALLFGGAKLPKLARSLGQSSKEFRKGLDEGLTDDETSAGDKSAGDKSAGDK